MCRPVLFCYVRSTLCVAFSSFLFFGILFDRTECIRGTSVCFKIERTALHFCLFHFHLFLNILLIETEIQIESKLLSCVCSAFSRAFFSFSFGRLVDRLGYMRATNRYVYARCIVYSFTSNTVHLLYWAGSAIFLASKCILIRSGSSRYYSHIENRLGQYFHLNRSTRRPMCKTNFSITIIINEHASFNCYVRDLTSYFILHIR